MPVQIAGKRRNPSDTLARLTAKRGVTQRDVARAAGVTVATVNSMFQREQDRPLAPELRARYECAIDAAVAERDSITASAAAWLRDEIAAGRLAKNPSHEDLRYVAGIVRSAVLANGANGR